MEHVMIELLVPDAEADGAMAFAATQLPGAELDQDYGPIEMTPRPEQAAMARSGRVMLVRARIAPEARERLLALPHVLSITSDEARIEPF
jgi:hypothetical protein